LKHTFYPAKFSHIIILPEYGKLTCHNTELLIDILPILVTKRTDGLGHHTCWEAKVPLREIGEAM
jgi:hypothetical protein